MLTKISDLDDPAAQDLLKHVTMLGRLDAYLESLNEKQRDPAASRGTFTASGLGAWCGKSLCGNYTIGCGRKLWYRYTGVEAQHYFSPRQRRVVDTGFVVHDHQLDPYFSEMAGRTAGAEQFWPEVKVYAGEESDELGVATEWETRVRLDGLYKIWLSDPEQIRISLEFKTINDKGFQGLRGPKPEHKTQLIVGMACQDTPVGLLIYYNKNDSAMSEYRVLFDHEHWQAVKDKIMMVRQHAVTGEAPPREGGHFPCRSCEYSYVCAPFKKSRARSLGGGVPPVRFKR